jgi:hypothetical protein
MCLGAVRLWLADSLIVEAEDVRVAAFNSEK